MSRFAVVTALLVAALALIVAGPAAAGAESGNADAVAAKKKKKKSATTVTADLFHYNDGEIIEGMVAGAKSFCAADQHERPVQIFQENGATDILVAETTARIDPPPYGFFESGILAPAASGTQFYALAPKDKVTKKKICLEGVSPILTVP